MRALGDRRYRVPAETQKQEAPAATERKVVPASEEQKDTFDESVVIN